MDRDSNHERVSIHEAFKMIVRNPDLSHGEKALWMLYRSYDDGEGAWVGDTTAAEELGVSERSVQGYRAELMDKGFIRQRRQRREVAIHYPVLPRNQESQDSSTQEPRVADHCGSNRQESQQDPQDSSSNPPHPPIEDEKEGERLHGVEGDPDVYGGQLPKPSHLVRKGDSNHLLYPPAFRDVWDAYPSRGEHSNPKKAAYRVWRTTVTNGTDPETLLKATRHYSQDMESKGKAGTEFVKQASTFFGRDDHWREHIEPPTKKRNTRRNLQNYGRERIHLTAEEVEEMYGDD